MLVPFLWLRFCLLFVRSLVSPFFVFACLALELRASLPSVLVLCFPLPPTSSECTPLEGYRGRAWVGNTDCPSPFFPLCSPPPALVFSVFVACFLPLFFSYPFLFPCLFVPPPLVSSCCISEYAFAWPQPSCIMLRSSTFALSRRHRAYQMENLAMIKLSFVLSIPVELHLRRPAQLGLQIGVRLLFGLGDKPVALSPLSLGHSCGLCASSALLLLLLSCFSYRVACVGGMGQASLDSLSRVNNWRAGRGRLGASFRSAGRRVRGAARQVGLTCVCVNACTYCGPSKRGATSASQICQCSTGTIQIQRAQYTSSAMLVQCQCRKVAVPPQCMANSGAAQHENIGGTALAQH